MEKNSLNIELDKSELETMSPLTLAYLGDTIYESYIREYLIKNNPRLKINDFHKKAIEYVSAKAQSKVINKLRDTLNSKEERIYKRGRNQKKSTSSKNANIIDYRHSTGFEALVGYLYLSEDIKRLDFLVSKAIEIIEKE